MSNKFLVMVLDAPLQSWGTSSKFGERTTGNFPTKSALVGMIAAAMGVERNDESSISMLAELKVDILSLTKPSLIHDFHTIGGGYEDKGKKFKDFIPCTVKGKSRGTILTNRYYLCDAKFGVVISGNSDLLKRIGESLRKPKWGMWAGRKSCMLSDIAFRGVFDSKDDAIGYFKNVMKIDVDNVSRVIDGTETDGVPHFIMDSPVNFAKRSYEKRSVTLQ